VRSSPSESGTELFILHEGTKIKVNEEVSGWQNIKLIDGREGWIMGFDCESI
jgi:SH3-like domain-containing protein